MKAFEKEKLLIEDRVMNYASDIKNGNIPAGKKFKQAVERFYQDLKNHDYWMDWEEVMKLNRWAGMFKHTKGILARQRITLTDYQLFIVANIFGFKKLNSNNRKYKEAYIQVGKKNAKTQLISIMVSYVAFLSHEEEEINISSWVREQSKLVYDATLTQIGQVDMLRGKYSDSYQQITVKKNNSIIKALSREAKKFNDGGNPSMAVLDEYKDNLTIELYDIQKNGMIARVNPLLIIITTAGLDLNVPCYTDYLYYSKILDPQDDATNDEIFIAISELDEGDDINDENNWVKANPIVATYEAGIESLRSSLKKAQDQPDRMRSYLTKHMNLWVDSQQDGYMELKRWNACEVIKEEAEEFKQGSSLYVGLDLSSTTDLTSVGMVYVKNGKYLVEQHSYVPEEKFAERMARDRVRYDMFVQQGLMTKTPGTVVDYNYLKEHVLETARVQGIIEVCYDKWNATHLAQDMQNEGLNMVEIPQSISQLSEPTKRFREAVYEGKIMHNGDQLLRWSMSNAVVRKDPQENIMVSKKESRDRIDPVAAILNAFSRARYDDLSIDLNEYIASDDFSF